jgi:hypothetical protein
MELCPDVGGMVFGIDLDAEIPYAYKYVLAADGTVNHLTYQQTGDLVQPADIICHKHYE